MKKILFSLLILTSMFIFLGCDINKIVFEGNDILKTKELKELSLAETYQLQINNINLKTGSIKIDIIEGEESLISIKTDENILEDLDITLKGNLIKIIGDKKYRYDVKEFTIEITKVKLNKLILEGAFKYTDEVGNYDSALEIDVKGVFDVDLQLGNGLEKLKIKVDGISNANFVSLDIQELNLHVNGTFNIAAVGKTTKLIIDANGMMNLDLKDLQVKVATINMDGTINSSFYVTDDLSMDVDGLGNIDYYGNPEIENIETDGLIVVTKKAK